MNAYVVRHTDNKELVGIFTCTLGDLAWLVDECTDVDLCEYAPLGPGGFMWTSRTDLKVPLFKLSDLEESDDDEKIWAEFYSNASLTEDWGFRLIDGASRRLTWRPIEQLAL